MAHWIIVLRNNSFVNVMCFSLLYRNFGAIHQAQPGLMAGWQASWLAGRQADKIVL